MIKRHQRHKRLLCCRFVCSACCSRSCRTSRGPRRSAEVWSLDGSRLDSLPPAPPAPSEQFTESIRRPSPCHGPPVGSCNRHTGPEQPLHRLALAAAGHGKPSLAAFCPPKCPPKGSSGEEPGAAGPTIACIFDFRASHVTYCDRQPSKCGTLGWPDWKVARISVGDITRVRGHAGILPCSSALPRVRRRAVPRERLAAAGENLLG
jgi:hypothetical protein